MQRVLSVSLSHVLRATAILLIPFSFISLIAWATAGSASGSTTDPIRGAVWIWLGAHHIPFQLTLPPTGIAGYLSYLPIGGVVLPFIAVRSAFTRAVDRMSGYFHDINGVRVIFSAIYALIVTLLAIISRAHAVTPQWYLAPLISFVIALLATLTAGSRVSPSRAVRVSSRITALILGAGLLILALLIAINFNQVRIITVSLQPGIFGGALLLFLNLLYLPNAAIAAVSYFSGTGLAVGAGTLVSPLSYHLGQIPALPLLGVLPTSRIPLALFGLLFFIGIGALLVLWSLPFGIQTVIQSFIFTLFAILILGYLASGSLITSEMGAVGVSIWKFSLSIAIELGVGAGVTIFIKNRNLR